MQIWGSWSEFHKLMRNKNRPVYWCYKKMKISDKHLLACFGKMFLPTFIYDTEAENTVSEKVKWNKDNNSTQLINQV